MKKDNRTLKEKLLKGLDESFKQLVKDKKRRNETFVWSIDGKIVHVKAKDVKLK